MQKRLWFLTLMIAVLGGCADAGRGLNIGGAAPEAPPLYAVEREIQTGRITGEATGPLQATARVALVIGNQQYSSIRSLLNPAGDARAIAALLRQNGHRVIEVNDATKQDFEKALQDIALEVGIGGEVLVFYAGHGFQVDGVDYLVPTDAVLTAPQDLPFNTVRLETLFRAVGPRSQRHVSILDACRNNPFPDAQVQVSPGRGAATPQQGFTEPEVPDDGLVAYSTQPGEIALDGVGEPHSPFAAALLSRASRNPATAISTLLRRVRQDVRRKTGGRQVPTIVSRLSQQVAFSGKRDTPAPIAVADASGAIAAAATVTDAPAQSVLGAGAAAIRLEVPREKMIAIGARLAMALNLPPEASVSLISTDAVGSLAIATDAGQVLHKRQVDFSTSEAGAVFYRLGTGQIPSRGTFSRRAPVEVKLAALINVPGQARTRIEVTLVVVPDACDAEAGDWLDTQGVGVYPEKGTVAVSRAVNACKAAVGKYPDHARFRFQLGKSLMLAGDLAAAERELLRAAEMGHLRAWHRLGLLYQEQGNPLKAKQAFENGLQRWDPAAAVGLGELLLKGNPSDADREKAWDLLTYATDLGMCDASRILADSLGEAGASAWAEKFRSAQAQRSSVCLQERGGSGGTTWQVAPDGGEGGGGGPGGGGGGSPGLN